MYVEGSFQMVSDELRQLAGFRRDDAGIGVEILNIEEISRVDDMIHVPNLIACDPVPFKEEYHSCSSLSRT